MKKYFFVVFCFFTVSLFSQLPIGSQRNPVYLDNTGNGNVVNPLVNFSNQITVLTAPTKTNEVVRFQDVTNSTTAFIYPITVAKGGTGTNTMFLAGVWTNGASMVIGSDSSAGSVVSSKIIANVLDYVLKVQNVSENSPAIGLYDSNAVIFASFGTPSTDITNLNIRSLRTGGEIRFSNGGVAVKSMSISNNLVTVFGNLVVTNGITGSVTNFGVGYTNIEVFAGGILTNLFRTGP